MREASFNTALLRAAPELAPAEARLEIASIRDIPLYDGDVEASGVPAAVTKLKDQIAAADGLLIVTPEYNHSIPGVLKNAIDWLSRPPSDMARVFTHKKVGLIGATPGRGGTRFAQDAWLQVFRALALTPYFDGALYLDQAGSKFESGRLVDPKTRELLAKYLSGFVTFCAP